MAEDRKQRAPRQHLFEWVEDKLRPAFESPQAGTYDADSVAVGEQTLRECPVCSRPMTEHTIDHSTTNTVLNCPGPHPGAWDRDAFQPVNEFGMVVHNKPDDDS
jgi:hypothetical protein